MTRELLVRAILGVLGMTLNLAAHADPVYTAGQAEQGKLQFERTCASCHGPELEGGQFGPALKGESFEGRWAGKALSDLFYYIRNNMPPTNPGSLGNRNLSQVIAWILQQNGVAAGGQPLPDTYEGLQAMLMPGNALSEQERMRLGPGGPVSPNAEMAPWPMPPDPRNSYRPVTDELLINPPAGEWPSWRRSLDGKGFSPLAQINTDNVDKLQLDWSMSLPPGANESTPLYHDGILFVQSFKDHVQAFNAVTGNELWHYRRRLPEAVAPSFKKSIALYGDKVYLGTSDLHVVALDAKTGKVVWDRPIGELDKGFDLTGGPMAIRGKIMTGIADTAGGPGGGYVVALDADTGKEAWRFYSIPRPGEPGYDSWNDIPLEKRTGGSVWVPGSYDAENNLAFFGPAPTYDTGPMRDPVNKPGVTNDALYTDTTVAINPDTGKLVWYYQHLRNDQWDMDFGFTRQILDLPVNGMNQHVVVTGNKAGIFDAMDAKTGKYLFSFQLGIQNFITAIDPETGEKTINPKLVPGGENLGRTLTICPHAGGGKNWIPDAINPHTHMLFVPLAETCMDLIPIKKGDSALMSGGFRFTIRERPGSDGRFGRIQAVDLKTGKTVWKERQRAAPGTGILATKGGLLFAGALDRSFSAYDQATGKRLWHRVLTNVPSSAPITYSIDGKQYVAVVVGYGGHWAVTEAILTPEISLPVSPSSSLWVFSLPSNESE